MVWNFNGQPAAGGAGRPLAGLAAALAVTCAAAQDNNPPAAPGALQGVVVLQASAQAEVAKDVLSITLATTREGVDAATVQAGLKQALDAALQEARKAAKPGQLEVQTGNFSLSPRYGKDGRINGWQGSAELLVEGRDMAAIGQLAGRIGTLSVARVGSSVSRELSEQTESELTAQAIARFRAKAGEVARQFGYAGHVVRQVNVGANPPVFMAQESMRLKTMSAMVADAPLPIEAGKATVTVTVNGSVQMLK
jgi:predicted secreted protein